MEKNIEMLRSEYVKEKKKGQDKDAYILELSDQIRQEAIKQKNLNFKMEELQTKLLHYEKELAKMRTPGAEPESLSKALEQEFQDKIRMLEDYLRQASEDNSKLGHQKQELEQLNKNLKDDLKQTTTQLETRQVDPFPQERGVTRRRGAG